MKIQRKNGIDFRCKAVICCICMCLAGCGINGEAVRVQSVASKEAGEYVSKEQKSSSMRREEKKRMQSRKNQAIQDIVSHSDGRLTASYPVKEDFWQWLYEQYGIEILASLQQKAQGAESDIECWYQLTGKSLHVLWVEYCRATGAKAVDLDKVYEKECANEDQVVLDFTGDLNLAEGWSTTKYLDSQPGGIEECFSTALWQEMQAADILMINNEYAYSNRGMPLSGKAYTFRANPERISEIVQIGADVISLANNHVWDYGADALLDTLEVVKEAGIPYVGAGKNLEEAMKPVYFIANGRKIAIVAATQIERSLNYTKEAATDQPGVLKTLNPEKFLSVIRQAKSCSDYVIAFVHWGTENTNYYGSDQTKLGQSFADAGVDVIIGGHPHCLQGFDFFYGKPVIYSLGNFWFNDKTIDTGLSQVVIHTDTNEIEFRFLPCVQKGCVTSLVETPQEKQRILDFMQRISAPGVSVDGDGSIREVP